MPCKNSGTQRISRAADHTAERQRAEIRTLLGFREAGVADAESLPPGCAMEVVITTAGRASAGPVVRGMAEWDADRS
jgi:hypothetical protein